ncbi:MAG: glycosyltransferase family 4 protein [Rhizobiales bacterium]|nr:glycosyltransferase family 4 protein [Hyphomicrobiales bacterium]
MTNTGDIAAWLGTFGFVIFLSAAVISFGLLLILLPLLQRYALAHPNARSSHKIPTPQGAGIGVIAATIGTVAGASVLLGDFGNSSLWLVLAATVFISSVGAFDDISPIPVLPRLFLQAVGVAIVLAALPGDLRVAPLLPHWLERPLLGLAILWFVNLVNFMDGIDWMTAAETVPATAGLVVIGGLGALPMSDTVVALALCGAVVGFAPLNRPVARLFLGDVGSLAIGLLLAWLLVSVAGRGHIAAALLLPLYYIADATITLFRRVARGEPIWQAHRTHFYQRATERGFTVMAIVGRVLALNIALTALAIISVCWDSMIVQLATLACGAALVGWLLFSFVSRENIRL